MAVVEEAVRSKLAGAGGLTALVGTRIRPVRLKQDETLPAVAYQRVSGLRESAMGADPGTAEARFQISAWAEQYSDAKAVIEQVRAAVQRWNGTTASVVIHDCFLENELTFWEDDTKAYQCLLDVRVLYQE